MPRISREASVRSSDTRQATLEDQTWSAMMRFLLSFGIGPLFFFHAEDGIRDRDVTGVQTCALPIYRRAAGLRPRCVRRRVGRFVAAWRRGDPRVGRGTAGRERGGPVHSGGGPRPAGRDLRESDAMSPARAEIVVDLAAIRANVTTLRDLVAPAAMMVAVKADGYGHGMLPVARAAREAGAAWLGVATIDEALALRAAGDIGRVLCWLTVPGEDYTEPIRAGIDLTSYTIRELDDIAAA